MSNLINVEEVSPVSTAIRASWAFSSSVSLTGSAEPFFSFILDGAFLLSNFILPH